MVVRPSLADWEGESTITGRGDPHAGQSAGSRSRSNLLLERVNRRLALRTRIQRIRRSATVTRDECRGVAFPISREEMMRRR